MRVQFKESQLNAKSYYKQSLYHPQTTNRIIKPHYIIDLDGIVHSFRCLISKTVHPKQKSDCHIVVIHSQ